MFTHEYTLVYLACGAELSSRSNLIRHKKSCDSNYAGTLAYNRACRQCPFCGFPDPDENGEEQFMRDKDQFGHHVLHAGCWIRIVDMKAEDPR